MIFDLKLLFDLNWWNLRGKKADGQQLSGSFICVFLGPPREQLHQVVSVRLPN